MKEYFKDKYVLAYLLVALSFLGLYISYVSIIISSVWLFYHFVIRRYVDIYLIFLLVLPAIGFSNVSVSDAITNPRSELGLMVGSQFWSFLYDRFNDVLFIGPIALSSRLVISFAVLTRLFVQHIQIITSFRGIGWVLALFLSVVGLLQSLSQGIVNEGGITMGFRIVMTMGMLLLPLVVENLAAYYSDLRKIVFVSYLFLCLGLMNAHWYFVTLGLIPLILCFRFSTRYLFLPLVLLLTNQYWNYLSITAISILLLSFLTYFVNRNISILFRGRTLYYVFVLFPLFFTIWVLSAPTADGFEFNSLSDYARFKLYGDRKPIWDEVFTLIKNHPVVLPAGYIFDVEFKFLRAFIEWPGGAHNIFLEFGRQLGGLSMFLLSSILLSKLLSYRPNLNSLMDRTTLFSFLSIYFIFGITGNSLIYDGVGSLFWLLFGQFLNLTMKNREARLV